MLASLVVIAISVAVGFAVGGWYAYADALTEIWDRKVESLKPHGGMAFLLWKIAWIIVFLAGMVLPFALALAIAPGASYVLFSMGYPIDPITGLASPILALIMIAVGNRVVRKRFRSP